MLQNVQARSNPFLLRAGEPRVCDCPWAGEATLLCSSGELAASVCVAAPCSCISATATLFTNCLVSLWRDVTLPRAAETAPINRVDKSG